MKFGDEARVEMMQYYEAPATGVSLRDYFAAQALRDTFAALAAGGECNFNAYQLERCARMSYMAADAMLAERDKPKATP